MELRRNYLILFVTKLIYEVYYLLEALNTTRFFLNAVRSQSSCIISFPSLDGTTISIQKFHKLAEKLHSNSCITIMKYERRSGLKILNNTLLTVI